MSSLWYSYTSTLQNVQKGIASGLGAWGGFVGRRPTLVLCLSLVFAALFIPGLVLVPRLQRSESRRIWVSQHSKSFKDSTWVNDNFDAATLLASAMADATTADMNVITPEVVEAVLKVNEAVMAISVGYKGKTYQYPDICYRDESGRCLRTGFMQFWNFSREYYEASLANYSTPQAAVLAAVNKHRFPDDTEVIIPSIFALTKKDDTGKLISATTARWAYFLSDDADDALLKKWSDKYSDAMKTLDKDASIPLRLYYQTTWSFDAELNSLATGNTYLIAIAVALVVLFTLFIFSRRGCVRTRTSLGLLAFITVIIGIAAGYGFTLYCQIIFTLLEMFALPYIMLGMGIDMAYVIWAGVNEVHANGLDFTPEEIMRRTMQVTGLSITTTAAASVFAFALGINSAIPAVQSFCVYAVFCIVFIYLMMISFFLACFALTEVRIQGNRRDCACCCKGGCCGEPEDAAAEAELGDTKRGNQFMTAPPPSQQVSKGGEKLPGTQQTKEFGLIGRIIDVYGRLLLTTPGALFAVAALGAWFAMSIWAIFQVKQGLPAKDLIPDKSFLQPLIKRLDETFLKSVGDSSALYFRYVDFSSPAIQKKMLESWDYVKHHPQFDPDSSPDQSWLSSLTDFAAATNPTLVDNSDPAGPVIAAPSSDAFYSLIQQWLVDKDHRTWLQDMVFENNKNQTGRLIGARFGLLHVPIHGDDSLTVKLIEAAKDAEKQVIKRWFSAENQAAPNYVAFVNGDSYVFWEEDVGQKPKLFNELGYAWIGALILMLIMLVHPFPAVLITAIIVVVVVCLFGELFVFKLKLNAISSINTLMAVGLSIDYVLYVTHKFLTVPGDNRRERVLTALRDIGGAVVLGATSTVLAVLPLLGATSAILRYFAYLMLGTVVFGIWAGMAVMPVFMWLVGPKQSIKDGWEWGGSAPAGKGVPVAEGRVEPWDAASVSQGASVTEGGRQMSVISQAASVAPSGLRSGRVLPAPIP